jgi:hypothetical protein
MPSFNVLQLLEITLVKVHFSFTVSMVFAVFLVS